jgi:endonuclease/exonuclease/phosphatase family metal-dependent hydrolase
LVTLALQRASVGVVTLVVAELPHATEIAAAASNGRGERMRPCTDERNAQPPPAVTISGPLSHVPITDVVFRIRRILFLLCVAALLTGCAGGHLLARLDGVDSPPAESIAWYSPAVESDRTALARWRASVGPPVVRHASSAVHSSADGITVASWNTALGGGDIVGFVKRLRGGMEAGQPLILLLQEVYRRGDSVPRSPAANAVFAGRLGGASGARAATDIDSVAAELGMEVYYVPSMRNGGVDSNEDRGNAILADIPISNLEAIELPFERQRRVAVTAVVEGTTGSGLRWRLRVVSAHLDNTVARRAWIGSEYGRARQARGLVALLHGDVPTILGGDFNTWFGFSDQAYMETALAFPQTPTADRRATFRGMLRLDHLFYRLPTGWRASATRGDARYGSDHAPLVGSIRFH